MQKFSIEWIIRPYFTPMLISRSLRSEYEFFVRNATRKNFRDTLPHISVKILSSKRQALSLPESRKTNIRRNFRKILHLARGYATIKRRRTV